MADEVQETTAEATAQVAETLAPGSVTRDDETERNDPPSESAMSADDIRSIVREELDKAMQDLKAVVPETPAPEPDSFQQPVKVPWTHRGGHR